MKILLPQTIIKRLRCELARASVREIGGILMGEHVGNGVFRVMELTVQRAGGRTASFVRNPKAHRSQLNAFFERTGHQYERFNYLGEWHSHPSFSPVPSTTDVLTMDAMLTDSAVGSTFLLLLIAKLTPPDSLEISATAFAHNTSPLSVEVEIEAGPDVSERSGLLARLLRQVFRT